MDDLEVRVTNVPPDRTVWNPTTERLTVTRTGTDEYRVEWYIVWNDGSTMAHREVGTMDAGAARERIARALRDPYGRVLAPGEDWPG
ncbi:hypothetical protein Val02_03390 [Virgisporangium aliadipatigenens]|uniref:Uncharacterized protein n=1 Tax=Virgisporangium aliadipatigenens TaxID=741659 RepID=A0A8J4DND2_9ACTN|nr:hypothetical protein [Virgisporangium aliadipatigenens]GIJ43453.1 hypothetical protein Val02_03390 [Virgisporangium aliadipatigenens]